MKIHDVQKQILVDAILEELDALHRSVDDLSMTLEEFRNSSVFNLKHSLLRVELSKEIVYLEFFSNGGWKESIEAESGDFMVIETIRLRGYLKAIEKMASELEQIAIKLTSEEDVELTA